VNGTPSVQNVFTRKGGKVVQCSSKQRTRGENRRKLDGLLYPPGKKEGELGICPKEMG